MRLLMALILMGVFACGCATSAGSANQRAVSDVILTASPPAAINMDLRPGPDGVRVQLFLAQASTGQPVVADGPIRILLLDPQSPLDIHGINPLMTWEYTPTQLQQYLRRTPFGVGYTLTLVWQEAPSLVSFRLIAAYEGQGQPPVYSRALSIAMPQQASP